MKINRTILISLVLLIIMAAIYRLIPTNMWGFIPHIAMALFGGAVIKDRKWAFALPIFSIFLSDLIFQALYVNGMSTTPGFYEGQITNYLLFAGLTMIGFAIKRVSLVPVALASVIAPTVYFLASNFFVWIAGAGFARPKTFGGLIQCYTDALPFYKGNLVSTLVFSAILFGSYYYLTNARKTQAITAK